MKKVLFILAASFVMGQSAFAQVFSAVSPSDDTLYYDTVGGNAVVVAPFYNTWADITEPEGELIIPASVSWNGTTYPVTAIGRYAFTNCLNLTSVVIPESVTKIDNMAFMGCMSLVFAPLPSTLRNIGYMAFQDCTGLPSVVVPDSIESVGFNAFGHVKNVIYNGTLNTNSWRPCTLNGYVEGSLVYADDSKATLTACLTSATHVTLPASVTAIGGYAFMDCIHLQTLEVPSTVDTIGANAFYYVNNVVYSGSATGSPWGAKTLGGYVESPFVYADATKTTLTGYWGTADSLAIPEGVTAIGTYAFSKALSLSGLRLPSTLTTLGYGAFNYCANLQYVTFNEGLQTIDTNAFYNCRNLRAIRIPASVNHIAKYAFWGNFRAASVVVDRENPVYRSYELDWGGVPHSLNAIIERSTGTLVRGFAGSVIPSTVTTLYENSFGGIRSLQSLDIPASVTAIGKSTFENCNRLATVRCFAHVAPELGEEAFSGQHVATTLYVPLGCREAYAAWAEYFDTILEAPLYSLTVSHNGGMVTLGTNTLPQHYLFHGTQGDTLTLEARSVFDEGTAADLDITGFNHLQHVYIDSVEVPLESIHQVSTSMFIRYTLPVAFNADHQVRFEFSDTPVVGIEDLEVMGYRLWVMDGRIVVEGAEGATAALYTADGRHIFNSEIRNSKFEIQTSSLPTGVYILSLDGNGQKIVIKN
ncbi:MAG: leucine-rich repeat domain-containing protein [Bacteroidales bacterium]|nr:leucine-rich repeat domain-containing protein [Bacteroidales bacterium]